jgi:hypothetical protein
MKKDDTFSANDNAATVIKSRAPAMDETKIADETKVADKTRTVENQLPEKTRVIIRAKNAAAQEPDRDVCIGDVVKDRFVLDRVLGTGGMGAVFRALDLRKKEAGDNRPYVALKILGADFKNHPDALVTL